MKRNKPEPRNKTDLLAVEILIIFVIQKSVVHPYCGLFCYNKNTRKHA